MTVGLAESLRSTGQAGHPGRVGMQLESKESPEAEFPLPGETSSFLLRPSTYWLRPTHIMEGNLLYLTSTDLNVNLI